MIKISYGFTCIILSENKDSSLVTVRKWVVLSKGCRIIKQHVTKSKRHCSSSQKGILSVRQNKSFTQSITLSLADNYLLLPIQPLDFYKILTVLNIMMTVDFLFSPKAAFFSIYLLLKPLLIKTSNCDFRRQKEFVYSLKIVHQ